MLQRIIIMFQIGNKAEKLLKFKTEFEGILKKIQGVNTIIHLSNKEGE